MYCHTFCDTVIYSDIISAYLHCDIISSYVHRDTNLYSVSNLIIRIRRVFANGAHVVICGLLLAYNFSIDVHKRKPSSPIPQLLCCGDKHPAPRTRRDFANGSHVVIYLLQNAFNSSIASHSRNPRFPMRQCAIFNFRKDFANGAHVVIV